VPSPLATADPSAARLVFFGPPNAGKSRLLEAVARVAGHQAEEPAIDLTHAGEPVLNTGSQWRRELLPHILQVDLPGPRDITGAVILIDCDGEAAQQLLQQADQLRRGNAKSALADAVRQTDALVVVLDATNTEQELTRYFEMLDQFLTVFEDTRVAERDVGGLPVFLTLTKCDGLYQAGQAPTKWLETVDRRKRELEAQFKDWFSSDNKELTGFGTTDTRLYATAVQVPEAIAQQDYTDSSGAFGVVELTHDLIASAQEHRRARTASSKRLGWTAGLAMGLLGVVAGTLLMLASTAEPGDVDRLESRVRRLQLNDVGTAPRLAEARLEGYLGELNTVRESEVFAQLPTALRDYINERWLEATAYSNYRERFLPPQFGPADVRTARDLLRFTRELDGPLNAPEAYRNTWTDTEYVKLRTKWKSDLDLLRRAEDDTQAWFRGQTTRANELLLADVPKTMAPDDWQRRVKELLDTKTPFDVSQKVTGSEELPVRRGQALSYSTVLRYERTANANADWQATAQRLTDVLDLAQATGLVSDGKPVFVLKEATEQQAVLLLNQLGSQYPNSARWNLQNIPGSLNEELTRRVQLARGQALAIVRTTLNAEAKTGSWAKLAETGGLLSRPEMLAWGKYLRKLDGILDPTAATVDPVLDLTEFLKKKSFAWEVSSIEISLPSSLQVRVLKPDGELVLRLGKATYRFKNSGESQTEPEVRVHRFTNDNPVSLIYTPGEECRAELTLRDSETTYLLVWDKSQRTDYQFECLTRTPTIEVSGANALPRPATGVKLLAKPAAFRVPVLLTESP
jgi:GTPase SAR1 family protein